MCDKLVRCVCDGRGIDITWSVPPSFLSTFYEEEEGFLFLSLFLLSFSSLVCLFVCVFVVVRGGVICVACIIILYSRTVAIHFKRFY